MKDEFLKNDEIFIKKYGKFLKNGKFFKYDAKILEKLWEIEKNDAKFLKNYGKFLK